MILSQTIPQPIVALFSRILPTFVCETNQYLNDPPDFPGLVFSDRNLAKKSRALSKLCRLTDDPNARRKILTVPDREQHIHTHAKSDSFSLKRVLSYCFVRFVYILKRIYITRDLCCHIL